MALIRRVDEDTCNPLRAWHRMGEPDNLNAEQLAFLRAAGQPAVETQAAPDGNVRLTLKKNAVLSLRALPAEPVSDDGYDYSYYCGE